MQRWSHRVGPHDYHQIHQSWSKMMQPTDSEGDLCGLISGGNIPYSSENQTCPLKNAGWKMIPFLLKWPLLRGHVRFQGCHNFVPFDEPLEKKRKLLQVRPRWNMFGFRTSCQIQVTESTRNSCRIHQWPFYAIAAVIIRDCHKSQAMRRIPMKQPGFYGMYIFVIVSFCCLRRFES